VGLGGGALASVFFDHQRKKKEKENCSAWKKRSSNVLEGGGEGHSVLSSLRCYKLGAGVSPRAVTKGRALL